MMKQILYKHHAVFVIFRSNIYDSEVERLNESNEENLTDANIGNKRYDCVISKINEQVMLLRKIL